MNQIVSLCVCASLKYFPLNLIYGSAKFAISSYFSRCCFSPGNIFFSPSSARFSLSNTFCATLCDTLQNYKCLHARYMLWLLLCYTQLAFCLFIYLSPMLNAPYLSQHHTKERCTKKHQQLGHSDALARMYDAASATASATDAAPAAVATTAAVSVTFEL